MFTHDKRDGACHLAPAAGFEREAAAAGSGEAVVLGLAVVLARAPVGGEPAAVLQAMERGIERALLDFEHVFGGTLNDFGDGVAMCIAGGERAQDHHVERAFEHVAREWFVTAHAFGAPPLRVLWGDLPSRRTHSVRVV